MCSISKWNFVLKSVCIGDWCCQVAYSFFTLYFIPNITNLCTNSFQYTVRSYTSCYCTCVTIWDIWEFWTSLLCKMIECAFAVSELVAERSARHQSSEITNYDNANNFLTDNDKTWFIRSFSRKKGTSNAIYYVGVINWLVKRTKHVRWEIFKSDHFLMH